MINRFYTKYHFEIIIFSLALVFRLILFFINYSVNEYNLISTIKADDGYYELSQNIINGHGFSFDNSEPYRPNSLRPPLWPYLIAFFAYLGSYWLVFSVEIIMGSFIPVFGYKISKYLIGNKMAKILAFLMIFEPYSILLSFLLYSETPFTFFFLISIYFLVRYFEKNSLFYIVWSGVFLGLAVLIKPTVQYFPFIIPLYFALAYFGKDFKRRILHSLVYSLVIIAIISPWLYRNYNYFGKIDMTVQPVFNLYVYLVPTVLSIDNGTSFAIEIDNFVYKRGVSVFDINLANADYYKKQALPVIMEHKLALIKSVFITVITFFTHDGILTVFQYSGIKIDNIVNTPFIQLLLRPMELFKAILHYGVSPAIFIIFGRLTWYIISLLFVYGLYKLIVKNEKRIEIILFGLIVVYFAITTSINGFGVNARFRIPVTVIILSFAVNGFYAILSSTNKKFLKNHEEIIDSSTGVQ